MSKVGCRDAALAHDEVRFGRTCLEGVSDVIDYIVGTLDGGIIGGEVQAGAVLAQVRSSSRHAGTQARTRQWRRQSKATCCERRGRRAGQPRRGRGRQRETWPWCLSMMGGCERGRCCLLDPPSSPCQAAVGGWRPRHGPAIRRAMTHRRTDGRPAWLASCARARAAKKAACATGRAATRKSQTLMLTHSFSLLRTRAQR